MKRFVRIGLLASSFSVLLAGNAAAQAIESVPAEADPLRASLPEVKAAILSATRYEAGAVEVGATKTDLVVTLINSDLCSRTSSARADEAAKIAGIIADSLFGKAGLQ